MGKIIGLDTSIFIYVLEAHSKYFLRCQKILQSVEDGHVRGIFSAIGLIEILTGPKRIGDDELATKYKNLITTFPNLSISGLNEHIIDIASDLRGTYNIKTPDAIHIATAIDAGANAFITNDKSLKCVKEIRLTFL